MEQGFNSFQEQAQKDGLDINGITNRYITLLKEYCAEKVGKSQSHSHSQSHQNTATGQDDGHQHKSHSYGSHHKNRPNPEQLFAGIFAGEYDHKPLLDKNANKSLFVFMDSLRKVSRFLALNQNYLPKEYIN